MRDLHLKRDVARSMRLAGFSLMFELSIGANPNIEEVEAWKAEFERTRSASNYQIVGFRQVADGAVNAIIAKRK